MIDDITLANGPGARFRRQGLHWGFGVTLEKWTSQFANHPARDFALYLELLNRGDPVGEIFRAEDGELYLVLFGAPNVRLPLRWLQSLVERAETLPRGIVQSD